MHARMATRNDIAALIGARFAYFRSDSRDMTEETQAMINSQLLSYIPEHLNRDFFAALVEDESGGIVSTAFLVINEKPANPSFPTGKTGLFLNVHTLPEHRRKGYARQAMELLIEEAKRQGLSYIELSASEAGKPLYEKLGFKEPGASGFTEMRLNLL